MSSGAHCVAKCTLRMDGVQADGLKIREADSADGTQGPLEQITTLRAYLVTEWRLCLSPFAHLFKH